MPNGHRETEVHYRGMTQVVRTVQTSTVTKLEREHTAAVKAAITAMRTRVIDDAEAQSIADIEAQEWSDKPGWPEGHGQIMKNAAIRDAHEGAAKIRKWMPKGVVIRSEFEAYRRPFPKVKFDIPVTDPRVADAHEYIPDFAVSTRKVAP